MNRDTIIRNEVLEISISVRITGDSDMGHALQVGAEAVKLAAAHLKQLDCKPFMSGVAVTAPRYHRRRQAIRAGRATISGGIIQ